MTGVRVVKMHATVRDCTIAVNLATMDMRPVPEGPRLATGAAHGRPLGVVAVTTSRSGSR